MVIEKLPKQTVDWEINVVTRDNDGEQRLGGIKGFILKEVDGRLVVRWQSAVIFFIPLCVACGVVLLLALMVVSFLLALFGLPATFMTALPVLIVLLIIFFKFVIGSDEAGAEIAGVVVLGGVSLAMLDWLSDGWISGVSRAVGLL